jgi:putative membrane protein
MKTITRWIISALAIGVTAYLLPGVHVSGIVSALVLAIVLGAINTFIRPVLVILTLPLSIFTLGLFTLVLNALLIMLATFIVPGFSVNNFWWAFLFGIVLAIVHAVLHKFDRK